MAIVIALQQRPETAQSLANKFEVSKRTVLRDMQSLAEIGIPLYSLPGPKGGFRLMDGFQMPAVQLDTNEALTVLFALRAMTKMPDTPFNQARWTVIDKITNILPAKTLQQIEPVLERVEVEVPERNYRTPYLSELLTYTSGGKWLRIFYRSKNHRRFLEVLPKRIYTANGFWYCEAYSLLHQEERLFRVDRIDSLEEVNPAAAEVLQHKQRQQQSRHNEAKAAQASSRQNSAQPGTDPGQNVETGLTDNGLSEEGIRIRAKLTYRAMLQVEQDVHIGEAVDAVGDDVWEVDFMCPPAEWSWAVQFFFALGQDADVIEPVAMRKEIFELSRQLCDRYRVLPDRSQ
jgi:predicted DNA-binding transcriptional regulator YafY